MTSEEEKEAIIRQGEEYADNASQLAKQGEYQLSLEAFEQAEESFKKINDQQWLNFVHHEQLRVYQQMGFLSKALNLADVVASGYLETKNFQGLALSKIHKADILNEMEKPEEALSSLRIAKEIITSHRLVDLSGYVSSMLAMAYVSIMDYVSAISELNKALEFYPSDSFSSENTWCLHQIGICYLKIADHASAERYLSKALEGYKSFGDGDNIDEVSGLLNQINQDPTQTRTEVKSRW